jgi:hypothetical protein
VRCFGVSGSLDDDTLFHDYEVGLKQVFAQEPQCPPDVVFDRSGADPMSGGGLGQMLDDGCFTDFGTKGCDDFALGELIVNECKDRKESMVECWQCFKWRFDKVQMSCTDFSRRKVLRHGYTPGGWKEWSGAYTRLLICIVNKINIRRGLA